MVHPLLLKMLTEFSPILRYAFSHFRVGFWGKSYREILLENQHGEQKKRSSVGTSPENLGQKIGNFPKKVMDIRWSKHFRPFSHFDRSPPPLLSPLRAATDKNKTYFFTQSKFFFSFLPTSQLISKTKFFFYLFPT